MKRIPFIVCLFFVIIVFMITCCPEPEFNIDHFKVYIVDTVGVNFEVSLKDQFNEDQRLANVYSRDFFANAVCKDGKGIIDSTAHLTWYKIVQHDTVIHRTVSVKNQFGKFEWRIGEPVYLLVPTQKMEPASSFPDNLDHFKCYEVFADDPLAREVELEDQFDKQLGQKDMVTVMKPMYFCTPVEKNERHIFNEKDHLACYLIKSETEYPPMNIAIENQFGPDTLVIRKSYMLLVPSQKLKFEAVE